ncbi:MAG: hypothetical protein LBT41_04635, partial [Candidatus Methanoplasma sp.]|nr:hypothetical protein [Candidatus Methanoplasma sp.]
EAATYTAVFRDAGAVSDGYNVTIDVTVGGTATFTAPGASSATTVTTATGPVTVYLAPGQTFAVSAHPSTGYEFVKWTKGATDYSSISLTTTVADIADAYTAVFQTEGTASDGYNVTIAATAGGSATFTAPGTTGTITVTDSTGPIIVYLAFGQTLTVNAHPAAGYEFVKWTKTLGDFGAVGLITTAADTVDAYTANFQAEGSASNGYNVTIAATAGGSATFAAPGTANVITATNSTGTVVVYLTPGQTLAVNAQPDTGFEFVRWTKGAGDFGAVGLITTTADASATYTANFQTEGAVSNGYNVTIAATAGGSATFTAPGTTGTITVTDSTGPIIVYLAQGQTLTVNAYADSGYEFVKWTKELGDFSGLSLITTAVNESAAYTANFQTEGTAANGYNVTIAATVGGYAAFTAPGTANTITVTAAAGPVVVYLAYGQTLAVDATETVSGYAFQRWDSTGTPSLYITSAITTTVDIPATYTAVFASGDTYLVVIASSGNGSASAIYKGVTYTATPGSPRYITVDSGDLITATAAADTGYQFQKWESTIGTAAYAVSQPVLPLDVQDIYTVYFESASSPPNGGYLVTIAAAAGGTASFVDPLSSLAVTVPAGGSAQVHLTAGQTLAVNADPNAGNEFVRWAKGVGSYARVSPITTVANASDIYTADFQTEGTVSNGYNVTIAAAAGGRVEFTEPGSANVITVTQAGGPVVVYLAQGESLSAIAVPNSAPNQFWKWQNGSAFFADRSSVEAGSPGAYTAFFNDSSIPANGYTITVTAGIGGSADVATPYSGSTVAGGTSAVYHLDAGAHADVNAIPDAGFEFRQWLRNSASLAPVDYIASIATAADDYGAEYEVVFQADGGLSDGYNVVFDAVGSGRIEVDDGTNVTTIDAFTGPAYIYLASGASLSARAVPDASGTFREWTQDIGSGESVYTDASGAITVQTDVSAKYTAYFVLNHAESYTVTGSADSGSAITPSGSSSVARGGSITFEFSALPGNAITQVLVDGSPIDFSSGRYTFRGVSSNHSISVFSADASGTLLLTVDVEGGEGYPEYHVGSTPYSRFGRTASLSPGADLWVSIEIADGYEFVGWTGYVSQMEKEVHIGDLRTDATLTAHLRQISAADGEGASADLTLAAVAVLVAAIFAILIFKFGWRSKK